MDDLGYPSQKFITLFNLTDEDLAMIMNMTRLPTGQIYPSQVDGEEPQCHWLKDSTTTYRHMHGYTALLVCVFGTVANALNVAVLTRKDMAAAPINRILTGIAIADILVMLDYIPFAIYMYIIRLPDDVPDYSYSGAIFVLVHMHFSQILHTISICLTLILAFWRYIAISFVLTLFNSYLEIQSIGVVSDQLISKSTDLYPQKSQTLCTDRNCTLGILLAFFLPAIICLPSYLVFSVRSTPVLERHRVVTLYHLGLSDLARDRQELLYHLNFWMYAVVIKLLPCVVLTVISYCLINMLYEVNERKQRLKGDSTKLRMDRTTRMLVAVLLLFLLTEAPQGVLGLLSGILGRHFFKNCYHQFGEVMDILALINGAINFILYCSMSRQFRTAFRQLFSPRLLAKGAPPETEVHTAYV